MPNSRKRKDPVSRKLEYEYDYVPPQGKTRRGSALKVAKTIKEEIQEVPRALTMKERHKEMKELEEEIAGRHSGMFALLVLAIIGISVAIGVNTDIRGIFVFLIAIVLLVVGNRILNALHYRWNKNDITTVGNYNREQRQLSKKHAYNVRKGIPDTPIEYAQKA